MERGKSRPGCAVEKGCFPPLPGPGARRAAWTQGAGSISPTMLPAPVGRSKGKVGSPSISHITKCSQQHLPLMWFHHVFLIQTFGILMCLSALISGGLLIACLAMQISCCTGRNPTFTLPQAFALLPAAAVCAHSHCYLFGPASNMETVGRGLGDAPKDAYSLPASSRYCPLKEEISPFC